MAGFKERLQAMRNKQETADKTREEEAKAKEQAERAEKVEGLTAERDGVAQSLEQANTEMQEASEAIAEAEAFAAEAGENLDPEAAAEIEAIKAESGELQQKVEELQAEMARIDQEIAALDEGGEQGEEQPEEQESQQEAREAEQAVAAFEDAREELKTLIEQAGGMEGLRMKLGKDELDAEGEKLVEGLNEAFERQQDAFENASVQFMEEAKQAVETAPSDSGEARDAFMSVKEKISDMKASRIDVPPAVNKHGISRAAPAGEEFRKSAMEMVDMFAEASRKDTDPYNENEPNSDTQEAFDELAALENLSETGLLDTSTQEGVDLIQDKLAEIQRRLAVNPLQKVHNQRFAKDAMGQMERVIKDTEERLKRNEERSAE